MKKIILGLLVLSILMLNVSAIDQPIVEDLAVFGALEQPVVPGTGTQGECESWNVRNEKCEGDIRHWDLCQKTVSGGVWQPHSENCKDYGSNVVCLAGTCQKSEDVSKTVMYVLIGLAVIFFVVFFWRKGRK